MYTERNFDRPLTRLERVKVALVLCLAAIVVLACNPGCAFLTHARGPVEQYNSAVVIKVGCAFEMPDNPLMPKTTIVAEGTGSGVVVGPHRVLSALHVSGCETDWPNPLDLSKPIKLHGTLMYMRVVTGDKNDPKEHHAEVVQRFPKRDIMTLHTEDDLGAYMSPIAIGVDPEVGDTVCEASGSPTWTYRCGIVQPNLAAGRDGDIRFAFKVEHGNSGSGLYDAHGHLVGIVVMLRTCEFDEVCEGYASSLYDLAWLAAE